MTTTPTFEEQFNPVSRRLRRVIRTARGSVLTALGKPVEVLVEVRWRLGDEIMALPIYAALRESSASCRVHVWCNYPELLEGNPHVDTVNAPDVAPDRYILLRGAPRTVYRIEHYARQAGVLTPSTRPRLFYEDWRLPILESLDFAGKPFVAVAAGATWPTKRWPLDCWRAYCAQLLDRGLRIVELGQGHEAAGVGPSLVDRTTVREAACVLRASQLLVCSDSGLMHLALAVGTPVLALFGPTDPSILIRNEVKLMALRNGRECQGCWNDARRSVTEGVCPLGVPECLGTITPELVVRRTLELIRGSR